MLIDASRSTLILIDFQQRLMPAINDSVAVIDNARRLADCAKQLGIDVAATRQVPEKLGPFVTKLDGCAGHTFDKCHFDACAEPAFAEFLERQRMQARSQFIIAGCEAHVCVLQTVLSLRCAGHAVALVADACGSRRPLDGKMALARASAAGAELVSTEMVLFEWLRRSDHPAFGAMRRSLR
ncbi:MAG: isochorismatase family protein [Janthinobacterium lividum]